MKTLEELEIFADENFVPIARKDFIKFLINLMKEKDYKTFLEIGTAIGYTAIQVALLPGRKVTTFEYFLPRVEVCKENLKDFDVEDKVDFIVGDALTFDLDEKFDVIFIDGSKAKTIEFFEKFSPLLNDEGTIIVDNIDLAVMELVEKDSKKNYYKRKIDEMRHYMESVKNYHVEYMPIGDGIYCVTKVKN